MAKPIRYYNTFTGEVQYVSKTTAPKQWRCGNCDEIITGNIYWMRMRRVYGIPGGSPCVYADCERCYPRYRDDPMWVEVQPSKVRNYTISRYCYA